MHTPNQLHCDASNPDTDANCTNAMTTSRRSSHRILLPLPNPARTHQQQLPSSSSIPIDNLPSWYSHPIPRESTSSAVSSKTSTVSSSPEGRVQPLLILRAQCTISETPASRVLHATRETFQCHGKLKPNG